MPYCNVSARGQPAAKGAKGLGKPSTAINADHKASSLAQGARTAVVIAVTTAVTIAVMTAVKTAVQLLGSPRS